MPALVFMKNVCYTKTIVYRIEAAVYMLHKKGAEGK